MKILLNSVGKPKDKHLRALAQAYSTRIGHYLPMDIREIREGSGRTEEVKEQEGQALLSGLQDDTIRVALDERGELMSSREFATFIEKHMVRGTRYLAFFIGGAAGLDPTLMQQCHTRISLSPMTLPHEVARVILLEQIYRAMTIIRNEPYHKD